MIGEGQLLQTFHPGSKYQYSVKVKNPILPTRRSTFALENQTRYIWMDGPLGISSDFYPCGIIRAFTQGLVFKWASQWPQPFLSQDLNRDSSNCLPYISFSGDSENLMFNQITVEPDWYLSLFLTLVCLIWYWYCKEKWCLGHFWEQKV